MLTSSQVKELFGWLKEQVKPVNKLKVELGDKEYKAGFLAGYKQAYEQILGCEGKYLTAIALAEREKKRREQASQVG